MMFGIQLWVISLMVALAAAMLFTWSQRQRWGFYPFGGLSVTLAVFLLFLLFTPRL
ncbi:MAG TPA: DUF3309 family protein [Polyangiaceae bacterium]